MLKNSPDIGNRSITMQGDPRILPVGKVLRTTKINELPQLINIFYGDMSFVGPRPLTEQTHGAYSEEVREVITKVKPGLSGVGSIIFRGEEELMQGQFATKEFYERVISPYKGELEKWFVVNKSLSIYFKVIFVTILVVLYPSTTLVWKLFKDLPVPPIDLKKSLKYR